MERTITKNLVLGLDMGTSSLGWALINTGEKEKKLVSGGVRIFKEPRSPNTSKIEGGYIPGDTLNTIRREKRGQRRNLERKGKRTKKLISHLIKFGFFPKDLEEQKRLFKETNTQDSNVYTLRSRAITEKIELFQLGRILIHLSQRRGFQSNRKSKKENDSSVILSKIKMLDYELHKEGKDITLGQYLSHKLSESQKIRTMYTQRDMYKYEFNRIFEVQEKHFSEITEEVKKILWDDIFDQRSIISHKTKVGNCAFFLHRQRARKYSLWAQRFRLIKEINSLKYFDNTSNSFIPLSHEQREKLYYFLNTKKKATFETIRKHIGLGKAQINLESERRKELLGNITNSTIYDIIGEGWNTLNWKIQDKLVGYLLDIENPSTFKKVLKNDSDFKNLLTDEMVQQLSEDVNLPSSEYLDYSEKAYKILVPLMRGNIGKSNLEHLVDDSKWKVTIETIFDTYPDALIKDYEAIKLLFGDKELKKKYFKDEKKKEIIFDFRNPSVTKALTEARKIIQAIERQYGIPEKIIVESGKELQYGEKKLRIIEEAQKKNQIENEKYLRKLNEYQIFPSGNQKKEWILKLKLFDECEGICPYTGKKYSLTDALNNAQMQIEHIIPLSRGGEDNFMNMTLCDIHFNIHEKGDKTPFELFSGDPEKYNDVKSRIKNFPKSKQKKFTLEKIEGRNFLNQQLNDTRYMSKEIKNFLDDYFGGKSNVTCSKGPLTGILRYSWAWNRFLWDAGFSEEVKATKNRGDHRHHFIDAVVIALTNQGMLQKASELSRDNKLSDKEKIFGKLKPSEEFEKQLQGKLENIIISFAPKHKINGALHNETGFGLLKEETVIKLKKSNDGMVLENGKGVFIKRVPLDEKFEVKNVIKIYDKGIRELVRNHLSANEDNPKLAFPKVGDWKLFHKDKKTPIKSVRIYEKKSLEGIYDYKGEGNLFYETGSNHHVEILEHTKKTNKDGTPLRRGIFVTMLEAATRASKKLPVVQRKGPWEDGKELLEEGDWKFVMSLMIDDMVEINDKVYRVRAMSGGGQSYIRFYKQYQSQIIEPYHIRASPNNFKGKKVQVSPLGIKSIAND